MIAGLDVLQVLAATFVIATGSMVQAAVGFGLGLIAAPLLVLIDPHLVPGPILLAGVAVSLSVTIRERRAIDLFGLKWAVVGRIAGAVSAALVATRLPSQGTPVVFGALVLLAVGLSAAGLHVTPTRGTLLGAGCLSGFMGTLTSIGGPPMAMVYQRAPGDRLRATMSGYLAVGVTISICALALAGGFGGRELGLAALLLPGVAVGILLAQRAKSILDRGYTRSAVLALSAASSIVVIVRQLL